MTATTVTATWDGETLRPDESIALRPNQRYILTIRELPTEADGASAWDVLHDLVGTVDAPADWAAQHDHYLYGTPKRRDA